jgi:hypothetical protein
VKDTTDPRIRDGGVPTTTSSENTVPVKLEAGARLVFRAEERRIFIGVLPFCRAVLVGAGMISAPAQPARAAPLSLKGAVEIGP